MDETVTITLQGPHVKLMRSILGHLLNEDVNLMGRGIDVSPDEEASSQNIMKVTGPWGLVEHLRTELKKYYVKFIAMDQKSLNKEVLEAIDKCQSDESGDGGDGSDGGDKTKNEAGMEIVLTCLVLLLNRLKNPFCDT